MPGDREGAVVLPIPGTRACHDNARKLLQRHGYQVQEVYGVDHDSILFHDKDGRAKTAWLTIEPHVVGTMGVPRAIVHIDVELGFQI